MTLPITDPDARADAVAQAQALLDRSGVETLECCFPDLWGRLCGKRIPAGRFTDVAAGGFTLAEAPLAWMIDGSIVPVGFTNAETGFPNMVATPDPATVRRLPWDPTTALCFADSRSPAGEEMALDTRGQVRRATARLEALGVQPWVAVELEFHLCTADWQPFLRGTHSYSISHSEAAEPVLRDIRRWLAGLGLPVESSQAEYGEGQFEVNLLPAAAPDAADYGLLLRRVVREAARRHGLRATFMPSPAGTVCSGLHIHQSLRPLAGNENLFAGGPAEGPPPERMAAYMGGVLAHLPDITALVSPTINAYKRAADYTFAGNRVSWAYDNRTAAVRALGLGTPAARVEVRTPSSDANPCLAVAACLHAGADGIERGSPLPAPVTGNAYADEALPPLPRSLDRAVDLLAASAFCRAAFGDLLVDTVSELGRHEVASFAAHVSDWELERYRDLD
jgi:glutamine synthetase